MVARVTHYRIRPGKLQEFTATVQSLTAALHKLKGFRVLFVLRRRRSIQPGSHGNFRLGFHVGLKPATAIPSTTT